MVRPSNEQLLGFEFDEIVIDTQRRRVTRNGATVRLGRLTYQFLVALAEAAPSVVSQEEIAERLWGGRYVAPKTLRQRVSLLRQALGDDAGNPRYVRVIHGQGYRLIPDVRRLTPRIRRRGINRRIPIAAGLVVAVLAALVATSWYRSATPDSVIVAASRSVTVLPFDNLSSDDDDAFLAAALYSDVLTQLAKVGNLKLVSANSLASDEGRPRNLREIGDQLGVSAVLEGEVQRTGELIHVSTRLIDTRTNEHVWAEDYARELNASNIVDIQHQIAMSVTEALGATLSSDEVTRLEAVPTRNLRAYQLYTAGNEYVSDPNEYFGEKYGAELAAELYEQAIQEDPEYSNAWAALARAYAGMYFFEIDPTPERLELAERAIGRALELAPDSPETRIANGYFYYHGRRDYQRALEEFDRAAEVMPGMPAVFHTKAFIARRMGDFERSLLEMQRAIDLNPRSDEYLTQQGTTLELMRRYEEAEELYRQLAERWPDSGPSDAQWRLAWIAARRDGDVTLLKELPNNLALAQHPVGSETEMSWFLEAWTAAIYERDFPRALKVLDEWNETSYDWQLNQFASKHALYGVTYKLAGQLSEAREHFSRAIAEIREEVQSNPEVARLRIAFGEVLAGLERRDEAVQEALLAMELMPQSRDTLNAPRIRLDAVRRVLVPAGAYDQAIDELEAYLASPGEWSIEGLLPDPRLAPLRGNTRFETVVERYRRKQACRRPDPERQSCF